MRGSKTPFCVCVRERTCALVSTFALQMACGKTFLGQTLRTHKCAHHTLARYGKNNKKMQTDTRRPTHLFLRARQSEENEDLGWFSSKTGKPNSSEQSHLIIEQPEALKPCV